MIPGTAAAGMTQPAFEWSADVSALPINGSDPAARHASFTGAQAAGARIGTRIPKVLAAFAQYRRLTMAHASTLTDIPINSMCSVWNRLDTGPHAHQLGWIVGTRAFQTYTTHGHTVRREIHELTAAGRQAAFDLLKVRVTQIEDRR